MNLYRVISEPLFETIPVLDYGQGPREEYRIVEIVAAETRGKAKWSAWMTDRSFDGNVRDMPRFSVRLLKRGLDEAAGVVTDKYNWSGEKEVEHQ